MKRSAAPLYLALGVVVGAAAMGFTSEALQAPMSGPSHEMHKAMEEGHKKMMDMKMTGDVDHDFAMMMSMHHGGGIEMAEVEVEHGKDAQMVSMARKIIEAQKKEKADLEGWMKKHKPAAHPHQH